MAEEILNDSFPDLKELENKIGRKTPESLLIWMRDATDCEDGWRSDVVDKGDSRSDISDSFSDKINNLKQEMRWLRSADVRILRQLVAVHEGIEAMRWLMEEREALASHGSSLTGSLSSLVTVEEHGPSMSPCRESLSPTQDLTETTNEDSADCPPLADHGDSNHKGHFDTLESTDAIPPSSSSSKSEVNLSTHGSRGQAPSHLANGFVSASSPKSPPQDSDVVPFRGIKGAADTIRKALLRSNRGRGDIKVDSGSFALTQQSVGTKTKKQTQQSLRASQNMMEEEESAPSRETSLLGYDAQWCWVESQDDVTFL